MDLGQAYATLDNYLYYEETKAETHRKLITAEAALERLFKSGSRDRIDILDIGTGNGAFPLLLKQRGYEKISAHEIPGNDLSPLEAKGVTLYRDYDWQSVPSGLFDVVTLLDVAEHVLDPLQLFRQSYRVLKTGGWLYCHTPMVTATDRLMHGISRIPHIGFVGRTWQRGRTSIFHLQNYTMPAMHYVLRSAGFENVSIQQKNELSWPLRRYVEVYLCRKHALPLWLAPTLAPLFFPFLATDLMNPNKGIVCAQRLGQG